MPRMSKKRKQELAFFLNERGRIAHNDTCRKCVGDCKQSFRTVIVCCPCYESKRSRRRKIRQKQKDGLLWSSVFVTLVAKKYRFMQFELDMVFDTH